MPILGVNIFDYQKISRLCASQWIFKAEIEITLKNKLLMILHGAIKWYRLIQITKHEQLL
jgi:hypothetical protein